MLFILQKYYNFFLVRVLERIMSEQYDAIRPTGEEAAEVSAAASEI